MPWRGLNYRRFVTRGSCSLKEREKISLNYFSIANSSLSIVLQGIHVYTCVYCNKNHFLPINLILLTILLKLQCLYYNCFKILLLLLLPPFIIWQCWLSRSILNPIVSFIMFAFIFPKAFIENIDYYLYTSFRFSFITSDQDFSCKHRFHRLLRIYRFPITEVFYIILGYLSFLFFFLFSICFY